MRPCATRNGSSASSRPVSTPVAAPHIRQASSVATTTSSAWTGASSRLASTSVSKYPGTRAATRLSGPRKSPAYGRSASAPRPSATTSWTVASGCPIWYVPHQSRRSSASATLALRIKVRSSSAVACWSRLRVRGTSASTKIAQAATTIGTVPQNRASAELARLGAVSSGVPAVVARAGASGGAATVSAVSRPKDTPGVRAGPQIPMNRARSILIRSTRRLSSPSRISTWIVPRAATSCGISNVGEGSKPRRRSSPRTVRSTNP